MLVLTTGDFATHLRTASGKVAAGNRQNQKYNRDPKPRRQWYIRWKDCLPIPQAKRVTVDLARDLAVAAKFLKTVLPQLGWQEWIPIGVGDGEEGDAKKIGRRWFLYLEEPK